ncbi:MAG TPA: substrate-binding domain-containing protein, partial [Pseudonocardia sp.]|nr:substrate-binding domain-containing protein [Pseudonocardia sp.]
MTQRVHIGWLIPLLAIVLVGGGTGVAKLSGPSAAPAGCAGELTVVTASSFAPVLAAVAPALAEGPNCARLNLVSADGRTAATEVANRKADLWISDDAAWAGTQGVVQLAPTSTAGSGTVLAISPFYLVTDAGTASRLTADGAGWLGLARLLARPAGEPPLSLAVRDPAGSGDGMLAAGALGEAVWIADG